MSESETATTAHEERLEQLGAKASARERQLAGLARGREKVARAISLADQMDSGQSLIAQAKAMAIAAWPAIVANMIRMAKGEGKGRQAPPPASAQVQATQLVAGIAGLAIEAAPGSDGARPLAEMTLGELDATLLRLRERVLDMQAIDYAATTAPQQGKSTEGGEQLAAPQAGQAEAHPPAPPPEREA